MKRELLIFLTMLCIIIIVIYSYQPQVQIEKIREYNVLEMFDKARLNNIINNKFLLWENNTKSIPPIFKNYECKLYKNVPETVGKNSLIYIPEQFDVKYPMYFETIEDDATYYYPTKNSTIISNKDLKWIGDNNNLIVIGINK